MFETLPRDFVADLQHPYYYRDIHSRWFQWSSPAILDQSARATYYFVKDWLPEGNELHILEVGCGTGFLTLELARDGHTVIGVDKIADSIEIAERTLAIQGANALPVRYFQQDFLDWDAGELRFDAIIFNRVLHHLEALEPTMQKVHHLLKNEGRIICYDYAYDFFDKQCALWVYQTQRLLQLSGHFEPEHPQETDDDAQAIEQIYQAWEARGRYHQLQKGEDLLAGLKGHFTELLFTDAPWIFLSIANGLCNVTPEQEERLVRFIKEMEHYQTAQGIMPAVGFHFVGKR
ncbi:methyltransferase family protein [Thermosporothrix hazakensis]|jgi:SAM-dependent methyltransferase|uniref:Methyltransferase family protein n=1 Tax=Thermosporothrix hazakensis TaxID=644383 RepID=A0A326UDM6_THEHA|nr:class I SAM-dependent methyltransferase [Thermosporothrix hazakensis]PZW36035.1 methyltransferase family protein [Thermosporothrix hazakensis]GCE46687.1 hypothetical protein KTH_15560 [Thermosporothrix hazakensis]